MRFRCKSTSDLWHKQPSPPLGDLPSEVESRHALSRPFGIPPPGCTGGVRVFWGCDSVANRPAICGISSPRRRSAISPPKSNPVMRSLVHLALLALASAGLVACSQSYASRVDDRTFHIEGPEVPGGSDAPNRRLADKLCPRGYRAQTSQFHVFWPSRCL